MADDHHITKEQAEQLYDQYGRRLYRLATMILWDSQSAEDALHQVFVKLLSRRGGSGPVQSWERYLTRAVSNECRGILRRRKRVLSSPPDGQILQVVDGMGGVEEERQQVERALGRLAPEQREVIQLKVYEDMTFRGIAAVLGVSVHTVWSRYRYGMSKLKAFLLTDENGGRDEC